jgi:hypothetical protein
MKEPSPHNSRIALAGALAAIIVVGGGGFLLGRGTTERAPAVVAPAPVATPAPAPEPETERGVLGRADLIALASAAGDAAASGGDAAAEIDAADGRRFEIRLPFGCDGPASEDSSAAMRWTYDADDRALRVQASPVAWTPDQWWRADAPAGVDTIEGFWIMRPWTASEACPRGNDRTAATGLEAVMLPGQTLALGQVFAAEGSRDAVRDGKPYQAVVRVAEDRLDTSQGFRLRVSGRITRIAGGGPVRCQQPAGPEQRPICLIGMVLDEVAIENPASDETLATWSVAQRNAAER